MTLPNLLAIHSLVEFKATRDDIQRLLTAAERALNDAAATAISDENRFDAAYKCVLQCAMVSLMANGYRTSTSKPGHHQTAIQSLALTAGIETKTVVALDSLRKQRIVKDNDGAPISPAALHECLRQDAALLAHVRNWLAINRPDLC